MDPHSIPQVEPLACVDLIGMCISFMGRSHHRILSIDLSSFFLVLLFFPFAALTLVFLLFSLIAFVNAPLFDAKDLCVGIGLTAALGSSDRYRFFRHDFLGVFIRWILLSEFIGVIYNKGS